MGYDGCSGKLRHANRGGAIAALKRIDNAGLSAYRCRVCGGWHLGNTRKKAAARIDQLLRQSAERDAASRQRS